MNKPKSGLMDHSNRFDFVLIPHKIIRLLFMCSLTRSMEHHEHFG